MTRFKASLENFPGVLTRDEDQRPPQHPFRTERSKVLRAPIAHFPNCFNLMKAREKKMMEYDGMAGRAGKSVFACESCKVQVSCWVEKRGLVLFCFCMFLHGYAKSR